MVPFWGRCTTHFSRDFSGDWDVRWGYGVLTQSECHLIFGSKARWPPLCSFCRALSRARQLLTSLTWALLKSQSTTRMFQLKVRRPDFNPRVETSLGLELAALGKILQSLGPELRIWNPRASVDADGSGLAFEGLDLGVHAMPRPADFARFKQNISTEQTSCAKPVEYVGIHDQPAGRAGKST